MTEDGMYFCSNCHVHTQKVLVTAGEDGNKDRRCMVCNAPVVILAVNHDGDRLSKLEKQVEELSEEVRVLRGYILGGG